MATCDWSNFVIFRKAKIAEKMRSLKSSLDSEVLRKGDKKGWWWIQWKALRHWTFDLVKCESRGNSDERWREVRKPLQSRECPNIRSYWDMLVTTRNVRVKSSRRKQWKRAVQGQFNFSERVHESDIDFCHTERRGQSLKIRTQKWNQGEWKDICRTLDTNTQSDQYERRGAVKNEWRGRPEELREWLSSRKRGVKRRREEGRREHEKWAVVESEWSIWTDGVKLGVIPI